MLKFSQRKVNNAIRIEVESELLELNPLLNLPIRKGKLRSKYLTKRPSLNEWYKKHF
jgi:hypothetical protein